MSETKTIESYEEANKYAYAIKRTKQDMEKINELAKIEMERWEEEMKAVKQWQQDQLKPLQDKLEYFQVLLADFHRKMFLSAESEKEQNKLKSIKLPYGVTLKSTTPQQKLKVNNEQMLMDYAQEVDLYKVTFEPKWKEIKDRLTILEDGTVIDLDGTVIEFVEVEVNERKFDVKSE